MSPVKNKTNKAQDINSKSITNGGMVSNGMSVVLRPRMSEKTYAQSADGVFVFVVDSNLNKHQIADAVESTYKVTVNTVRIIIQNGKQKRSYKNRKYENGVRSDVKKAYVTLKKGDSIPIFASVEEAEAKEEKAKMKLEKKSKLLGRTKKEDK